MLSIFSLGIDWIGLGKFPPRFSLDVCLSAKRKAEFSSMELLVLELLLSETYHPYVGIGLRRIPHYVGGTLFHRQIYEILGPDTVSSFLIFFVCCSAYWLGPGLR